MSRDYDHSVMKERFAEPTERQLEIERIAWSLHLSNEGTIIYDTDVGRAAGVDRNRICFLRRLPKMQFPPMHAGSSVGQSIGLINQRS